MNRKAEATARKMATLHAESPEVRAAGGASASDADGWDKAVIERDLREAGIEPTDATRAAYREAIRRYLSRLGARGGAVRSARKAKTSAVNGRRGGRPRKTKTA